nr:protein YgfX [Lacimicrobium sp. SS2-24]
MVSEQGDWQWAEEDSGQWQLSSLSRVTGWLLIVCLVDKFTGHTVKKLIIFRDQVPERDYRRLCRIILRRQSTYYNVQE